MNPPTATDPLICFEHPASGHVLRPTRKFKPYLYVPAKMTSGLSHMEPNEAAHCVPAISAVLESLLAEEFREAGVEEHEIVCIRRVTLRAPAKIDWRNVFVLRDWLKPVAREIRGELLMGSSPSLLRFQDETAALIEFAEEALDGKADRAWAWRQMEFWREDIPLIADYAHRELRAAMWRRKGKISAVLRVMGERGKRGALLSCLAGRRRGPKPEAGPGEAEAAIYRL